MHCLTSVVFGLENLLTNDDSTRTLLTEFAFLLAKSKFYFQMSDRNDRF